MTSEEEYPDEGFVANPEGELIDGDEVDDLDGTAGKTHTRLFDFEFTFPTDSLCAVPQERS